MVSKKTRQTEIILGLGITFILYFFLILHLCTCTVIRDGNIAAGLRITLDHAISSPLEIRLGVKSISIILVSFFLYAVMGISYYAIQTFRLQDMPGKEEGSAKWNTNLKAYDMKYTSPKGLPTHDGESNMILSQDVFLSLEKWTGRNCNILCIGGSGTGKSRYFVKPNLLQANASFVVTDPSGELLESCGKFLEEKMGYKIKVFNTINMEYSNCYNPFFYLKKETDVIIMIDSLIKNTTPEGANKGDPFWEKSEIMLLRAVCYYLWMHEPKEKQNFSEVVRLVRLASPDENEKGSGVPLDAYFNKLSKDDLAYRQYESFRTGGTKTIKSIVISVLARLTIFDLDAVKKLTGSDNIDLLEMGDEKQALFIIVPTGGIDSFSFLASMLYTQLFEGLYYHAQYDTKYSLRSASGLSIASFRTRTDGENMLNGLKKTKIVKISDNHYALKYLPGGKKSDLDSEYLTFREGSKEYIDNLYANIKSGLKCVRQTGTELPVPVRFILDEFANIGQIPNFPERLATMRKYQISCTIIIQNLNQLKKNYEKDENTLTANCDTTVFLGSGDVMDDKDSTCAKISAMLGKTTIRIRSQSHSKNAKGGSGTTNMQQKGRPLLTPDEVSMLNESECLIKVRSEYPFRCKKHDFISHKNYKFTADADESNVFILDGRRWVASDIAKEAPSEPGLKEASKVISPPKAYTKEEFAAATGLKSIDDIKLEALELDNPSFKEEVLDFSSSKGSVNRTKRKKSPGEMPVWEYPTFT